MNTILLSQFGLLEMDLAFSPFVADIVYFPHTVYKIVNNKIYFLLFSLFYGKLFKTQVKFLFIWIKSYSQLNTGRLFKNKQQHNNKPKLR